MLDTTTTMGVAGSASVLQSASTAGSGFTVKMQSSSALFSLPEDRRELLVLIRFEGLRHDEISELLGCSVGAVRVNIGPNTSCWWTQPPAQTEKRRSATPITVTSSTLPGRR